MKPHRNRTIFFFFAVFCGVFAWQIRRLRSDHKKILPDLSLPEEALHHESLGPKPLPISEHSAEGTEDVVWGTLPTVPSSWKSLLSARLRSQGPQVQRWEWFLDGVRILGADRTLNQRNGTWQANPEPLPFAQGARPQFPHFSSVEMESHVIRQLDSLKAFPSSRSWKEEERLWIPEPSGWVPCVRYTINYQEPSEKSPRREQWCVHPTTGELVFKNQRGRF